MTVIETTPIVDLSEPGDHDRFAHYFRKADILRANFDGVVVPALCGKLAIPDEYRARQFEKCPTCVEIFERLG